MIPILPTVKISGNIINISFFDLQVKIDVASLDLFFKGPVGEFFSSDFVPLDFFHVSAGDFDADFMKESNWLRPKAKLKYFFMGDYVFGIDVSLHDKRLFFLAWLKEDYEKFRGGTFWQASFFINTYLRQKEWFEFDLSIPKIVWPFSTNAPDYGKKPQLQLSEFI